MHFESLFSFEYQLNALILLVAKFMDIIHSTVNGFKLGIYSLAM